MRRSHNERVVRHGKQKLVSVLPILLLLTPDLVSSSVLHPSTDHNPFEKIDIYVDRTAGVRNQDHQTVFGYPAWLTDPNALIVRYRAGTSGDTLAAARSYANDCTFIDSRATEQGYVQYAVDPPRFASSVHLLATGYYLFNDVSTYEDRGIRS